MLGFNYLKLFMPLLYNAIIIKIAKIQKEVQNLAQQIKKFREETQKKKDLADAEKIKAALLAKLEK